MKSPITKILLMIDEAYMGGGQQHLLWLAQNLDRSKYEISAACEGEGYLVDELKKIHITVYPINISNRPNIFSLIKIHKLLKHISPDILHTHGGTAGFYGRAASMFGFKGAVIHTYHGIHYLNFEKSFLKNIYKAADKYLLRYTDCTICVAQNDFNIGLNAGIVKKEKAVVIHNGVNVEKFNRASSSDYKIKLKNEPDEIIIGSVGRLHYQKGYDYLVDASAEVLKDFPKAKFVLIGEGELKSSLESSAKEKNVLSSFMFLGNQTDIPGLLSQMDIFVLPSLWEGLPLVLLEAMAAKKPVVATNVNGTVEIIESGKEGILVPPKNSTDLASAIKRLLNDADLREKYAEAGYNKIVSEFSLKTMVNKTEEVYLKYSHGK